MIETFCVGSFLVLCGIPFFVVASASLYSKLLPRRIQGNYGNRPHLPTCMCNIVFFNPQGFGQGVRRSVGALAAIVGPLWSGASMEVVDEYKYYPYFGVPLGLMVVIMVSIIHT